MVTPTKTDKKARCWWERLDLTGQHFVDPRFRTPAYEKAVKALVALRKEDPSLMTAAYAEAASTYIRLAYANSRRVRRSPGRNVFERLLGKNTYHNVFCSWMDHPSLWLRDGKPFVFACQPYHLSLDDLREIVRYCDAHNLDVHICSGWSWHYPGRTLFIELSKKE